MDKTVRLKAISIICSIIIIIVSFPVMASGETALTIEERRSSIVIHEGESLQPEGRQPEAYYCFTVEHEGYYTITAESASCDTVLYLYRSNGVFLCVNDDSNGTNSSIAQYLETGSKYYIKATSTGGGALRNYTVSLKAIWHDMYVTYNGATYTCNDGECPAEIHPQDDC
ncbi:MAG: hypothetical protein J5685_00650, partial [Clostridiales bacterium]|nr:hypothetical protein [Clostridiales bacterium]